MFAKRKCEYFRNFMELPSRVLCPDTFARIEGDQVRGCIMDWVQSVHEQTQGQVIAVHGEPGLSWAFDKVSKRPSGTQVQLSFYVFMLFQCGLMDPICKKFPSYVTLLADAACKLYRVQVGSCL